MIFQSVRKFAFILLILFSFSNTVSKGEETSPYFRHLSTENGLPSSEVYCAMQDSRGNLWFGTDRGAARYDGYEFRVFTFKDGLTDNTIFKIQEDNRGKIWMLSFSCRIFYLENEKVYPYKYNDILQKEGKNRIPVSFSIDSLQNLFVSIHSFGIIEINNKGNLHWRKLFNETGSINYIIDEISERKIISAYRLDSRLKQSSLLYTTDKNSDTILFSPQEQTRLTALQLSHNRLVFSAGKSLYQLRNGLLQLISDLPATILAISKDRNENLWVGTQSGVYNFEERGSFILYKNLLDNKSVSDILQDNEGGYWFTTLNSGVYYMPGYGIEGILFNEEPLQKPISLASDGHTSVFAGCWNGILVRLRGNKKEVYYAPPVPNINLMIYNLTYFTKDDKLYLARTNPGYIKNKKYYPITNKELYGIKTDYIQTTDNLLYGAGTTYLFTIKDDKLDENTFTGVRINCLARDAEDRIILGCADGAYVFDPSTKKINLLHKDLADLRIDDIKILGKKLILATKGKGLLLLENNKIETIDEDNGLCSNLVNKILIETNTIWCATNKGISKITFSDLSKSNYTIVNIGNSHGLFSDEINSITELNDTIYAASNLGVSYFNSKTSFANSTNPFIQINSLRINNSDSSVSDHFYLTHAQNNIHIGFTGISYRSKDKISYDYRLICGSDTLHSVITGRSVEFLSLSPGNYSFSVSAINNSGLYSKIPASISFQILPAWWQSVWFRVLLALLVTLLIYLMYISRLEKYKQRFEMERKQAFLQLTAIRAQMNPHFIFNVMNSIRNYMQNHDMLSAEKYLTSFSKLVRYTLDNSEVQEISLEEELNAVKMYAEHEMLRFENGFEFTIHSEKEIDLSETTILSMLLQPIIENAIKHGISGIEKGGKIQITIKKEHGKIQISIEDNGIGTKESMKWNAENQSGHVSFGTTINSERIKAYNKVFNKNITIDTVSLTKPDGTPAGTRVVVEL